MSETTIDRRGTRYEYLHEPGSTPIVLVHGVGLDRNIWRFMLGDFSGRSTLTYDLLGHGDTTLPLGVQSFEPFVGQLHHLLEQLSVPEIILAGFSLGGQVAKHFAWGHAEMVKALVLISTTHQRTTQERSAMLRRVEQAKNGDLSELQTAALRRWFNSEFLTANPSVEQEITARLQNNDPARFLECYELLANAEDHDLDYRALSMPTLILTGDGDPGSTPQMAIAIEQAMPDARAEIIQGSRHLGIIENHWRFSDAVQQFLVRLGL